MFIYIQYIYVCIELYTHALFTSRWYVRNCVRIVCQGGDHSKKVFVFRMSCVRVCFAYLYHLYITIYLCYSNLLIEIKPTLLEHVQYVKCLTCWDVFSTSVARPQLFGFTSCLRYMKGGFKDADLNRASAGCRKNAPGGPTALSWVGKM